ncbi:2-(R)-hydroxypropyl-CoM dehydrogenase [Halomonas elongata]|uniref:2-(R)-hydroxypropyl-CoM dehydrogenase n=1 Tax=Halomonas elongata TaxID=2746 RepID=A0A1B8P1J7_HALEL|nr:SDR family oxidoreductase [Halomonas elongata]OBX36089.1 2-(R)-hydroxypropyl-CoM dehydrogenase [Halomonas elongata]
MSKTWLITGTSTGLGRLLTERLLERGDRVVATLRQSGVLDELLQRHGDRLHALTLDVTDTKAIRTVMQEAFERMGRIDVVVSNAGYGLFGAGEEVSDAQIERQIATNLTGSIQLIRAALPHLREQGGGRIVQVSSEGGQIAYPNFSLYHATKWGIEGFVESVAKEVAPFGIDCLIIEPGPTGTNFAAGLDHAHPLACYEDTPAGEVRRAVASGDFAIKGMPPRRSMPSSWRQTPRRPRSAWRWEAPPIHPSGKPSANGFACWRSRKRWRLPRIWMADIDQACVLLTTRQ